MADEHEHKVDDHTNAFTEPRQPSMESLSPETAHDGRHAQETGVLASSTGITPPASPPHVMRQSRSVAPTHRLRGSRPLDLHHDMSWYSDFLGRRCAEQDSMRAFAPSTASPARLPLRQHTAPPQPPRPPKHFPIPYHRIAPPEPPIHCMHAQEVSPVRSCTPQRTWRSVAPKSRSATASPVPTAPARP